MSPTSPIGTGLGLGEIVGLDVAPPAFRVASPRRLLATLAVCVIAAGPTFGQWEADGGIVLYRNDSAAPPWQAAPDEAARLQPPEPVGWRLLDPFQPRVGRSQANLSVNAPYQYSYGGTLRREPDGAPVPNWPASDI